MPDKYRAARKQRDNSGTAPLCWKSPTSSQQDLALSLAHELNQPLMALGVAARACSQIARLKKADSQELIQAIDDLAAQAERANELVRRLRQLGGRNAPNCSMASIEAVIQESIRMLTVEIKKEQICLQLNISKEIPKISIDRIQMEQVLVNLLRNAIEALREKPVAERIITLTASKRKGEVVLVISDRGPGLSPEIANRLFQPYQTTKPQGMGLGLAVSRAILQAHSGRLWVEPSQAGAVFCLALPLSV